MKLLASAASEAAASVPLHACTLCGRTFAEKSDFNGHIKAHLKEKLNTRREQGKSSASVSYAPAGPLLKPSSLLMVPESLKRMLPTHSTPVTSVTSVTHPSVLAELAACKPIPPDQSLLLLPKRPLPISEAMTTQVAHIAETDPMAPTDMDMEADLMSFERELNRIDFHNDLSSLLDQIEKDFESPGLIDLPGMSLDTPPDSDSETSDYLSLLMCDEEAEARTVDLDTDPVSQLASPPPSLLSPPVATSPDSEAHGADYSPASVDSVASPPPPPASSSSSSLVSDRLLSPSHSLIAQSPASLARVGRLPEKALDLLSHLPGKLFVKPAGSQARLVNVVKVEQSTTSLKDGLAMGLPNAGNACAFINIECHEAGKDGAPTGKLIETFRAIDTGTEIKLIGVLGAEPVPEVRDPPSPPTPPAQSASVSTVSAPVKGLKANAQCSVCNKTITTKNLARHMEKHVGKKQFVCGVCALVFAHKCELQEHATSHRPTPWLACPKCGERTTSKAELLRHRRRVHAHAHAHLGAGVTSGRRDVRPGEQQAGIKRRQTCKDRALLHKHVRTQHAQASTTSSPLRSAAVKMANANIECCQCQRTFSRSSHLRRHERTAHGQKKPLLAAGTPSITCPVTGTKGSFLDAVAVADGIGVLEDISDADIFDLANITDEFYSTQELF